MRRRLRRAAARLLLAPGLLPLAVPLDARTQPRRGAFPFFVWCYLFLVIAAIGLRPSRWRRGGLNLLEERGLAGRRLGGIVTWFLLGGPVHALRVHRRPGARLRRGRARLLLDRVRARPLDLVRRPPRLWEAARDGGHVATLPAVFLALVVRRAAGVNLAIVGVPIPPSGCSSAGALSATRARRERRGG